MLVLARNPSESVDLIIPPSDTETVVRVVLVSHVGPKSRIGFEADTRVKIVRSELLERAAS